ncbi:hypothetical protein [Ramlibacter algicola]|uniref:Uncharacterized protein n=1 Tax=Ramlibacter algicola TaxID=2795217 RepID=A0A934UT01_9BURK|nr:hypothetical protein [Ramlibacter algicola]MBK0394421.1 hypothetical protein [Ramlibacter algicola]
MQPKSGVLFDWSFPRIAAPRLSAVAGLWIPTLAFALFMANLALHYPGVMNNDSVLQLRQATTGQYGDWHPPIMAWLWSWLLPFGEGPAPLLLLHLALYWAGFGLLAESLRRADHPVLAVAMVLAGAFPPFLYVNAQVVKDVGMAVAWLAATGALFFYRSQARPVPWPARIAITLLLFYGTMVRTNAIFGLGPLLLLAFAPASWMRSGRLMVSAVVVAVLALPASMVLNKVLFHPTPQHATQSLFLYDLMGIAVHTNDPSVLEPRATIAAADLRSCYSPYWWDSLSSWGRCADRVHRPNPDMQTLPEGLEAQWAKTIAAHPIAYAEHRLKHFNSALLFAVPLKHIRLTPEYRTGDPAHPPLEVVSERDVHMDLLRKNPFVWPVTWLTWSACLLVLLRREQAVPSVQLARVLAVSALGYSGAYLLIGVATDMRYHYWSLLAALVATIVAFPHLAAMRSRPRGLVTSAAIVAGVVAIGIAARLLDWRVFV